MKDKFFLYLQEIGEKIEDLIDKEKKFLIITHIDADGLSSATLFLHYLYYNNLEFHLTYAKQLDEDFIKNLYKNYPEDVFIFLDLGSGIIDKIKKYANRDTFIFDHHDLVSKEKNLGKIFQINPRIFGIDGSKEISTSGIVYKFLKSVNHDFYEISYLGLVGAIGDLQENAEFIGINKEILEELVNEGVIEVRKGLKIFGLSSKPLYKALEYSIELYIPGVTGNEAKAIEFLKKLKIPLKKKGNFTTYFDLNEEEVRRLISEIIKIRLKEGIEDAENVIGNIYIVKNNDFFKDLREITYAFNACGRMEEQSKIISLFLGDKKFFDDVQDTIIKYKKKLLEILSKIYSGEIEIKNKSGIAIIDLDSIKDTLVSPISTILVSSKIIKQKLLVAYSSQDEKYYKVSVRTLKNYKNLAKIVREAAEKVGGTGGGHDVAAGAIVPKDKIEEFIKNLRILARQENILL